VSACGIQSTELMSEWQVHQTQHWKVEKIDRDRAISEYNFRTRVDQWKSNRILKDREGRLSQPVLNKSEDIEDQVALQKGLE
jgi:hypothetical protein